MGDGNGEKEMEIHVQCLEPQKPGCAAAVASFSVYRRRRGCDLKAARGARREPRPHPVPGGHEVHDNTQPFGVGAAGRDVVPEESQVRRVGGHKESASQRAVGGA